MQVLKRPSNKNHVLPNIEELYLYIIPKLLCTPVFHVQSHILCKKKMQNRHGDMRRMSTP